MTKFYINEAITTHTSLSPSERQYVSVKMFLQITCIDFCRSILSRRILNRPFKTYWLEDNLKGFNVLGLIASGSIELSRMKY